MSMPLPDDWAIDATPEEHRARAAEHRRELGVALKNMQLWKARAREHAALALAELYAADVAERWP